MGPARTSPAPRPAPQGRCACGVEARPALAFAPGCAHHYGKARRGQGGISELNRGNRYDDAGRPDDDADGRGVRGIRTRMLRERTKAGLDAARREGQVGGRPPKLGHEQCAEIVRMVSTGTRTAAEAARLFRVYPATVSRLLSRA